MPEWKPTIRRVENRRGENSPDEPLDDVKKLIRRRNYKQAENELMARIEKNPKSADLMVLLGRVLKFQDRHDEAAQAFERAMELAPMSSEPSFRCGAEHLQLRNYERARELFENALAIEPSSARAYLGLGAAAYYDGAYDDAVEYMAEAIRLDPKLGRGHEMLARARARSGNKNAAISELQATLEDDPGNERILSLLVRLLRAEERSSEALEILQVRAENNPGSQAALRRVGNFALRTSRPDLAVATYRQLGEGEDLKYMDRLRLISALIENDEVNEAQSLIKSLPDRKSTKPVAVTFAGDIAFRQAKFAEATEHYKSACEQVGNTTVPDGLEAMDASETASVWRQHAGVIMRGILRELRRKRRGKG